MIQEKNENESILSSVKPTKVILPMILGLGIVAFFIYRDYNKIDFSSLNITYYAVFLFLLAFLMMFFRDFGYIIRIKVLSDNALTWRQSIRIIFLWEFASAVTPSAVGGTTVATFFLWREGMNVGKSASIVMATSFLDELYFSIMFPIILSLFMKIELFGASNGALNTSFIYFTFIGYSMKLAWTLIMAYSLFINPHFFARIINFIFKFKYLKKWKETAEQMANDFVLANKELKLKNVKFWIKSILATFLSWSARYWVLNFLLLALIASLTNAEYLISVYDHFLIFARQLIMWIMMLVMPTPGGSGFVETIFSTYMADFMPVAGFGIIMALLWRLVTYYPYLIIGAVISPSWLSKKRKK